jgi:hypothetical protein
LNDISGRCLLIAEKSRQIARLSLPAGERHPAHSIRSRVTDMAGGNKRAGGQPYLWIRLTSFPEVFAAVKNLATFQSLLSSQ